MKGCRPLNRKEKREILDQLGSTREGALMTLGLVTGYRISELLSIKIRDVLSPSGGIVDWICVSHTKNGESRNVKLNSKAAKIVANYARSLLSKGYDMTAALFVGAKSKTKAISRIHAWRLLKEIFKKFDMSGKLGTHTMRKTFALEMYNLLGGRIEKVQIALGHKSIDSTIQYLSFNHQEIDDALERLEAI